MDERLRICLWMVGGGGLGAVLGCGLGALTAALYAKSGGAAGTRWARRVAESFLDTALHPPSPTGRAALVGAVDGFLFLGILGLIAGLLLGMSGQRMDELLVPMIVGSVLMVGAAIFFGTLAYALTYYTAESIYSIVGSIIGGLLAANVLGPKFVMLGAGLGGLIAFYLCRTVRRYAPKFQPPRVGKTTPLPHSDANTDITDQSPSQIQKMNRQDAKDAKIRREEDDFQEGK
jgi:hypothetical protein